MAILQGVKNISQIQIWAFIAQTLITYVFIQVATGNAAKQNNIDNKRDLRTTKEDLMAELKDSRETLLRESEVSTTAIIDVLKAEMKGIKNENKDKT